MRLNINQHKNLIWPHHRLTSMYTSVSFPYKKKNKWNRQGGHERRAEKNKQCTRRCPCLGSKKQNRQRQEMLQLTENEKRRIERNRWKASRRPGFWDYNVSKWGWGWKPATAKPAFLWGVLALCLQKSVRLQFGRKCGTTTLTFIFMHWRRGNGFSVACGEIREARMIACCLWSSCDWRQQQRYLLTPTG